MSKGFQKQSVEEIDEHDQPTEPMPRIVLSPFDPTVAPGTREEATVPIPQASEQPFPRQQMQRFVLPFPQQGFNGSTSGSYPFLPPLPGGVNGQGEPPVRAATPLKVAAQRALYLRYIPLGVGLGFVLLQFLLLVRFSIRLINLPTDISWVSFVYAISELFVLPFRVFLPPIVIAIPINIELYTLLAVVAYSFLSRLLVHSLKVFLNIRKTKAPRKPGQPGIA